MLCKAFVGSQHTRIKTNALMALSKAQAGLGLLVLGNLIMMNELSAVWASSILAQSEAMPRLGSSRFSKAVYLFLKAGITP
jgi:hypothetical protein